MKLTVEQNEVVNLTTLLGANVGDTIRIEWDNPKMNGAQVFILPTNNTSPTSEEVKEDGFVLVHGKPSQFNKREFVTKVGHNLFVCNYSNNPAILRVSIKGEIFDLTDIQKNGWGYYGGNPMSEF
ncbi:hypothetical protein NDZ80_001605 [Vibrio vulnificus]|nr:hypothetical protein [Vibrio vulnificus]